MVLNFCTVVNTQPFNDNFDDALTSSGKTKKYQQRFK